INNETANTAITKMILKISSEYSIAEFSCYVLFHQSVSALTNPVSTASTVRNDFVILPNVCLYDVGLQLPSLTSFSSRSDKCCISIPVYRLRYFLFHDKRLFCRLHEVLHHPKPTMQLFHNKHHSRDVHQEVW